MFNQISLIAAFIAGMVALFAPCCFSYLLPAYFGNIFKEKKRVILMTLIYSLGIFVAILPFLGIKLPMPQIAQRQPGRPDVVSTFTLGLFSGITSACCAPVLLGVITLSALTPGILTSLLIGAVYVLGMVAPLYVASAFIESQKLLEKPIMRRQITSLMLGGKTYPIFVSNLIAGVTFAVTGLLLLYLTLTGKLGMPEPAKISFELNQFTQSPLTNLIFVIIGLYLLYKFVRRGVK